MSKSVNVDFVTRQIEVDTDGKEHFISAAMAAKDAEQSMLNAQNAATSVKKYKALWFDSVAAMKAEPSLTAGAYVCTAGYYTPNDDGSASYLIRAKADADVDDGGSIHELANGLVAELIVESGTVCPEQFGAKGDGVSDDTEAVKLAINSGSLVDLGGNEYSVKSLGKTNKLLIKNGTLNGLEEGFVIELDSGKCDVDITLNSDISSGILINNSYGNIKLITKKINGNLLVTEYCNNLHVVIAGENISSCAYLMNGGNRNVDIMAHVYNCGDATNPTIYINSSPSEEGRNSCITIHDCVIKNSGQTGILCSGEHITIQNVIVDTAGLMANSSAIWVHDSGFVTIKNAKVSNTPRYGVFVNKSINVYLENIDATNNNYCGLLLGYDNNTTPWHDGTVSNKNAVIVNSCFYDNNNAGPYSDIRIDGWKNVTFLNCVIGEKTAFNLSNAEVTENISFINCVSASTNFFGGISPMDTKSFLGIVDITDLSGHKISFEGRAPNLVKNYYVGDYTANRSVAYASTSTMQDVFNVLATLVLDLKEKGILK